MLTEACRVWDVALGRFAFSPCIAELDLGGKLAGMSTLGKVSRCFECVPLLHSLPHCGMMDSKLFKNGLITLLHWFTARITSLSSLLVSFLLGVMLCWGFYRGAHIFWGSSNQVYLMSSIWFNSCRNIKIVLGFGRNCIWMLVWCLFDK